MGKKCRSFASALGNISVYALVIFIRQSVLIIFSNLTFLDTKQSGSSLSSKSSASSVSRFENHSSRSDTGVKRYSKKLRIFSNEVSSNNGKSHFPGQLAEIFRLANISIYLKPCSSTNLKNWIFTQCSWPPRIPVPKAIRYLSEIPVRRQRKKLWSASNVVSSNNRLTLIWIPFVHHTGRERLRRALLGLEIKMIISIRNWQKKINEHLVKIPL